VFKAFYRIASNMQLKCQWGVSSPRWRYWSRSNSSVLLMLVV